MRRLLLLLATLLVVPKSSAEQTLLIGYLPYRSVADLDMARYPGLTDLILFSAEPRADGSLDLSRLAAVPWDRLRAFQSAGGRVHICLGGWGHSEHFAAVTADDTLRARLVSEVVRLCAKHDLAGVDLDWEHPKGKSQLAAYGQLVAALHAALAERKGLVSVTLASANQLPSNAVRYADRIQLMAYDMPGPHATLEAASTRIDGLLAAGVPAHKVILGVPFYGRGVSDRSRTLPYREIRLRHRLEPGQDEVDDLTFNGPVTVKRKAGLVLERALGGAMVWELTQDASGPDSLLAALRLGLDAPR